ncbi:MAG: dihydrofolate reductase [Bacteroidales bacterium]|nr:dihydrofolate reductase [Bacteroidales bacterium]
MIKLKISLIVTMGMILFSCNNPVDKSETQDNSFDFFVEQFADIRILRYHVPEFEKLTLKQKELLYYLSQAALCGRDIFFDQNGKYNLAIRRVLENIYKTYSGDRTAEDFKNFEVYLKRVWFSNGIYHHYSTDKFLPGISTDYFMHLVQHSDSSGFPLKAGQQPGNLMQELIPVMFDAEVMPKKVCQDTDKDIVAGSAVNFYHNVSQQEVEQFYEKMKNPEDPRPVSYGLNSKVVKEDGKVKEIIWKEDGMYTEAIEKIIFWLGKSLAVAETPEQASVIQKLISYYKTGNLKTWDEYNVLWVNDLNSHIDFVNGFIETYDDPLGLKATWEAVVNFKDLKATHRTEVLSSNAQWFEDNSPVAGEYKKSEVKGVTAKVITVAQLGGACYPATPIGINLPNADWIRKEHGSKSVTMENITYAYDQANQKTGMLEEFASGEEEIEHVKKYGFLAGNLHVDLHECLGHGSGQLKPGVASDALKNYMAPLEETRADLFALYYIMDEKMVDLGLLPNLEVAKAEYMNYIRNGLMTQLTRIQPGKDIEQAHMRNRQLISKWCMEKGKADNVIEKITRDGKTYFRINNFEKLRSLFGELLREVQRIKSEGDYQAGKDLVETYGVKVDRELHREVLERYEKLNLAPYSGFLNPEITAVEKDGTIIDVTISYPDNYAEQMMFYSDNYSYLPDYN